MRRMHYHTADVRGGPRRCGGAFGQESISGYWLQGSGILLLRGSWVDSRQEIRDLVRARWRGASRCGLQPTMLEGCQKEEARQQKEAAGRWLGINTTYGS